MEDPVFESFFQLIPGLRDEITCSDLYVTRDSGIRPTFNAFDDSLRPKRS